MENRFEFKDNDYQFFLRHTDRTEVYENVFWKYIQKYGIPLPHKSKAFSFLDVGCGAGNLTIPLMKSIQQYLDNADTSGPVRLKASLLDPCQESLRTINSAIQAAENHHADIEYIHSTFEEWSENPANKDNLYDFILLSHVFYYFKHWEAMLTEIMGHLNPGGLACVILKSQVSDLFQLRKEICITTGYHDTPQMDYAEDIIRLLQEKQINYLVFEAKNDIIIPAAEILHNSEESLMKSFMRILSIFYHMPPNLFYSNSPVYSHIRGFFFAHVNDEGFRAAMFDKMVCFAQQE